MLLFQLVVDGLGRGAIYAGLGMSLVLVFKCTGLINFAQGEFATLSTYLTFGLWSLGLQVWLAVLLSMAVSGLVAALVESTVVRPVLRRPHLVVVIMTIGLYVVTNAVSQLVGGPNPRRLPGLFPDVTWSVFGVRITASLRGCSWWRPWWLPFSRCSSCGPRPVWPSGPSPQPLTRASTSASGSSGS